MPRLILILLLVAATGAQGRLEIGPEPRGAADLETGKGFVPLASQPSVHFEQGAGSFAQEVARHLRAAMDRVEAAHGRAFLAPAEVYVCATLHSFVRLSPTAIAVTRRDRIFLSPRLFLDPARVPTILTHELAHVHFVQHAGTEALSRNIPAWFREGYAVQVADGGLQRVSRDAAAAAIRAGRAFVPGAELDGRLPWTASEYGIDPPMFYRQSAMFVGYLEDRSPKRFHRLVSALLDGIPFPAAFPVAYGGSPSELWDEFVAALGNGD